MDTPIKPGDVTDYLARISDAEKELIRLFRPDEQLTILDVGSCEGEDSVRYARRFPRARIFAFEPLPANQALIRANFAKYSIANAELIPLALSDRQGEATFHVSSGRPPEEFAGKDWNYGNKSSSLLSPANHAPMYGWVDFKQAINVRTATLEQFCRERGLQKIDFVHMDVQGAEHMVLAGGAAVLPRITALWLEVTERPLYQGQKLRAEMERTMRAAGFALGYEVRREIEGDQFYVNARQARTWPYLAHRRASAGWRHARAFAARLKKRCCAGYPG